MCKVKKEGKLKANAVLNLKSSIIITFVHLRKKSLKLQMFSVNAHLLIGRTTKRSDVQVKKELESTRKKIFIDITVNNSIIKTHALTEDRHLILKIT